MSSQGYERCKSCAAMPEGGRRMPRGQVSGTPHRHESILASILQRDFDPGAAGLIGSGERV
jgi:hypothetical protein